MYFFSLTAIAFLIFGAFNFLKPDPLSLVAPPDFTSDDEYEDESDREEDPEWDNLTEDEKKAKLDNQLDEYYQHAGKKSMLAWAYLIGFNKGKGDKND